MSVKKYICELCGNEISASNFSKHIRRHENHPETFVMPKYRIEHDGLNCQFCEKLCKNKRSLFSHEKQCPKNLERHQISGFNQYNAKIKSGQITKWNKGLTAETDPRIAEASAKKKGVSTPKSAETRDKISKGVKKAYAEGRLGTRLHRLKHDRNYYGTYAGIECDSSYELAFVIYNIDHNIRFERNLESFNYVYDSEIHKYFPDFKLDGSYVEIKGRVTEKDLAKWEHFPKDMSLLILDQSKIQPYIKYCVDTYGKNFTSLYDPDKPSWMNK